MTYTISATGGTTKTKVVTLTVICPSTVKVITPIPLQLGSQEMSFIQNTGNQIYLIRAFVTDDIPNCPINSYQVTSSDSHVT